jgi:hypothetical protein
MENLYVHILIVLHIEGAVKEIYKYSSCRMLNKVVTYFHIHWYTE